MADDHVTNSMWCCLDMGVIVMAEMVALVFVVLMFSLMLAFFLGDSKMGKLIGIVIGVTAIVAGSLAVGFGLASFFVWLFMLLWNVSVVPYFGLAALTFWKAWGFILISSFLFKGSNIISSTASSVKLKRKR